MWFKNSIIYRIPQHTTIDATKLSEQLATHRHTPIGSFEAYCRGWVPAHGDDLVYTQDGHLMLNLRTDKKLLPSSVIKEALKERVAEVEEREGYKPGRKQIKEIKEDVTEKLLAEAFTVSSETAVWIDTARGWLVVNTASRTRADEVVGMLIKSVDQLALETLFLSKPIGLTMTGWLLEADAPIDFSVDQECELAAGGEDGGKVRYSKHSLETEDVAMHIRAGKSCTRLAMTWKDRVSFVLTDTATIRKIKPLDLIAQGEAADADGDRFSTDFALMTGELSRLFGSLIEAFGGIKPKESEQELAAA